MSSRHVVGGAEWSRPHQIRARGTRRRIIRAGSRTSPASRWSPRSCIRPKGTRRDRRRDRGTNSEVSTRTPSTVTRKAPRANRASGSSSARSIRVRPARTPPRGSGSIAAPP